MAGSLPYDRRSRLSCFFLVSDAIADIPQKCCSPSPLRHRAMAAICGRGDCRDGRFNGPPATAFVALIFLFNKHFSGALGRTDDVDASAQF